MKHVVTQPSPPFTSATGAFEVHQILAWQDNLIWLFVCRKTGAAAVIDGPEAQGVLDYAEQRGITVTHVINTHTHPDHIGINQDLSLRGLLAKLTVFGAAKMQSAIPGLTHGLSDGDTIEVGACKARVLLTEGHIDGHLCFVFDDVVFSGDALFAGGCGRVFTGDFGAMYAGLSRLKQLDPVTRVCCAHEYTQDNLRFAHSVEPHNAALSARIREVWSLRAQGGCAVPSSVGMEHATNPMLRWDSEELIAQVRQQAPDVDLSSPRAVFTATRKLKDAGAYRAAGDAGLPL